MTDSWPPKSTNTQDEYARLVLRHRTQGTYGRAADAMRRGICDVLKDRHGRLLRLYTAAELGTLVGGIHKVDPAEWEAHATYGGTPLSYTEVMPWICVSS